jgi:hypothetical protein
MSQKKYTFFTIFFVLALLALSSVAWKDYVVSLIAGTGI